MRLEIEKPGFPPRADGASPSHIKGADGSQQKPQKLSLAEKVKDLQFGHEHFHLFEIEEAFLHFCSVNL